MKRLGILLVFVMGVFLPREARVAPVFASTPEFEKLLTAPVILIVDPANPPFSKVLVPMPSLPDFEKYDQHFVVVEVLRDEVPPTPVPLHPNAPADPPMPRVKAGDAITVHSDRLSEDIYLHELYYGKGTSKSPLYEYYRPQLPVDGRRIVFLRREPWERKPEFAGVTGNAHEGVGAKEAVVAGIKRIKAE